MSFGELMKYFRERKGLTQLELSSRAEIAHSYVSLIERDKRNPPSRGKIMAIARALELDKEETDTLLLGAEKAPQKIEGQNVWASPAMRALSEVLTDAKTPNKEIIENVVVSFLGWLQSALKQGMLDISILGPEYNFSDRNYAFLMESIDDTLLEALVSEGELNLADMFRLIETIARIGNWEIKRRIAEALPGLIKRDRGAAIRITQTLKEEYYDSHWKADVRRRVIEALPELYETDPELVKSTLRFRNRDEIYTIMAITEVVWELESTKSQLSHGKLQRSLNEEVARIAEYQIEEPPELVKQVVDFLSDLIKRIYSDPEEAIAQMEHSAKDENVYIRICVARNLGRLMDHFPSKVLEMMENFLWPGEHKNVRRAIAKSLPKLIERRRSEDYFKQIEGIIKTLALDRDLPIRRAVSDMLSMLMREDSPVDPGLIDYLVNDSDHYVRSRAQAAKSSQMVRLKPQSDEGASELLGPLETEALPPSPAKEFMEERCSCTSLVCEIAKSGDLDEAGISEEVIELIGQKFQDYSDRGMIDTIIGKEKEEQMSSGMELLKALGITEPREVFERFSELFKCAKWIINPGEKGYSAEVKECRFFDIAKKRGYPAQLCEVCCLNLIGSILRTLESDIQFDVKETLWDGSKCRIEITE